MKSKRHMAFNISIIAIPWLSLLFMGRKSFKRYSFSGLFIILFEVINHLYGHRRKWWKFYDKPQKFIKNELPFSLGPYMPLSMWILKFSYGNFKKFTLMNIIADAIYAFPFLVILKKAKIVRLNRLNHFQFFIYLHYKAYLLYGVQYLYEKSNRKNQ